MAAQLRHYSLQLRLDDHPIGELHLDDVDCQVVKNSLKALFGDRLRTKTAELWLREQEIQTPRPQRVA